MDPYEDWRRRQEADRRRKELYDALRERDYPRAERAASPDLLPSHLRSTPSEPAPPTALDPRRRTDLEEERESLLGWIECIDLDVHGRIALISRVCAVDLASPDAEQWLEAIRREIQRYL